MKQAGTAVQSQTNRRIIRNMHVLCLFRLAVCGFLLLAAWIAASVEKGPERDGNRTGIHQGLPDGLAVARLEGDTFRNARGSYRTRFQIKIRKNGSAAGALTSAGIEPQTEQIQDITGPRIRQEPQVSLISTRSNPVRAGPTA